MLAENELKEHLHRDIGNADKLLITLASFSTPVSVKDIKSRALENGLRAIRNWNVSLILSRTRGLAINTTEGWELSKTGKERLENLGLLKAKEVTADVAIELRNELAKVKNSESRSYLEEAIKCYELKLYKSAVIMTWVGAVHILYEHILAKHLVAFNKEAIRVDSKWKAAMSLDDLGTMKEKDFLDRLAAISVLGKNVKEQLQDCLKLRNACGHPNTLKIGPHKVASHIEILMMNVFKVFI